MASREQLRKSAKNKLSAAKKLADGRCNLPVEVSYLCTVAMECSLKHFILSRNGIQRTEQINDESHQLYKLFHGTAGHDLERLRKMSGKKFAKNNSWTRMKNSERPYSLRYGSEVVGVDDCRRELTFTQQIVMRLEDEQ